MSTDHGNTPPIESDLEAKQATLSAMLAELGRIVVAYSGGVDSSFLLAASVDAAGADRVLAVTVDSPLLPRRELEAAVSLAQGLGVAHRVLPFDDLALPEVAQNPPERCYHCKRARFEALTALARDEGYAVVLHGENADDHLDYRPGSRAAAELGVRAPLAEAGLTKADIRVLSRRRGLPTWDHPSAACLASRFPYDTPLTPEGLARVERAEEIVRAALGDIALRVRDHLPLARIEVAADELARLAGDAALRQDVVDGLHALGYRHVTLDLEGYRMGSLNEVTDA